MRKQVFPRTYYSAFCSAFLLAVVVLLGSTAVLGQTNPQGQETPAAAAQSQVGQSQRVQIEGELEITYQDFKDQARVFYSLKRSDGTRVPLHFVKEPPTHLLTGDHVRADGQLSGGSLILYSGSTSVTKTTTTSNGKTPPPPSIPVPYTFGAQSTLVMLVNFQDDVVEPYTVADAQNMYFVTANNFFMENSYGQTSLTGAVVGWYTIPDSVTTCNMSQIATDAQNAAVAAGANLSNYTRYVYAFPQNNACGFAGSSYVGGNPSQSWINGSSLDIHVIDHELGHAFGIWHSHSLDCGTTATICSSGTIVEYGDRLDTIGTPQTASPDYNAFQKERLGWLNYGASPSIQTITSTGTYTINPYELSGPGPNALKILKSTDPTTGAKTWYYLEQRQAIGFDAFLTDPTYYTENETTGVLFHIGTDGDGNTGDLLDMTPATPTYYGWFDPSLVAGQSFPGFHGRRDHCADSSEQRRRYGTNHVWIGLRGSGPQCQCFAVSEPVCDPGNCGELHRVGQGQRHLLLCACDFQFKWYGAVRLDRRMEHFGAVAISRQKRLCHADRYVTCGNRGWLLQHRCERDQRLNQLL